MLTYLVVELVTPSNLKRDGTLRTPTGQKRHLLAGIASNMQTSVCRVKILNSPKRTRSKTLKGKNGCYYFTLITRKNVNRD